jgi:hypothetical protein
MPTAALGVIWPAPTSNAAGPSLDPIKPNGSTVQGRDPIVSDQPLELVIGCREFLILRQ